MIYSNFNKKIVLTVVFVFSVIFLTPSLFSAPDVFADSTIAVVSASKDAWIDQNKINDNHGNDSELDIKSEKNNNNKRALVAFNLPPTPSGTVFKSAKLRLFMYDAPSASRTYEVHRIVSDWVEGDGGHNNNPLNEVVWNNQPNVVSESTSATSTGTVNNATLEWDVTNDVASFYSGVNNFGWLIKDASEGDNTTRLGKFRSREYTAITANRPQLVLEYRLATGEISGTKFNDLNGNGVKDDNEPGLPNWTINVSGAASASAITDENGNYLLSGLPLGAYLVCEVKQTNWNQSLPSSGTNCGDETRGYDVNLISDGQKISGNDFGNFQYGSIAITKIADPENGPFTFNLSGPTPASDVFQDGEFQSTEEDTATFENLLPGEYSISEILPENWEGKTTVQCSSGTAEKIILKSGENITCTFNNTQFAVITGLKFHDFDANGIFDETESGLSGWTIKLFDAEGKEASSTETKDGGVYSFSGLLPGAYKVCETNQSGWIESYPQGESAAVCGENSLGYNINLSAGQNLAAINFGNYKNGSISGAKFEDLNDNKKREDNEPLLPNWEIKLFDKSGETVLATSTTDSSGLYKFSNLKPGFYRVSENLTEDKVGWRRTMPENGFYDVLVSSGEETRGIDFGNFHNPIVNVYKWQDLNADGIWQKSSKETLTQTGGEPGLSGWNIKVEKLSQNETTELVPIEMVSLNLTGGDGKATISLPQTGHFRISEESRDNWTRTNPTNSFFDIFAEFSGQEINNDTEGKPLRFGNVNFFNVSGGMFAPTSGNSSSTNSVIILASTTLSVSDSNGTSTVSFESHTTLKRTDGENFDLGGLGISAPSETSISGLAEGAVADGVLKWGTTELGFEFDPAITLSIFVGELLNGQTLDVRRSTTGTSSWTAEGIVSPATCVVSSGLCVFKATKASYYVASHFVPSTPPAQQSLTSSNTGNGGGGSDQGGIIGILGNALTSQTNGQLSSANQGSGAISNTTSGGSEVSYDNKATNGDKNQSVSQTETEPTAYALNNQTGSVKTNNEQNSKKSEASPSSHATNGEETKNANEKIQEGEVASLPLPPPSSNRQFNLSQTLAALVNFLPFNSAVKNYKTGIPILAFAAVLIFFGIFYSVKFIKRKNK